jgi:hypothetical protein
MALAFEQQPRESDKAFAAFKAYLEMGAERSTRAVGKQLGKSEGLIERWAARFDWRTRVQAHAAHLALVERKAAEAVAARYGADREKRRELEREDEWVLRTELMEAGRKVLEKFRSGERGATLGDVARALDIAAKLGRLSAGMKVDESEEEPAGTDVNVLVAIDVALDKIYGEARSAERGARSGEAIEAEVVVDRPKEIEA